MFEYGSGVRSTSTSPFASDALGRALGTTILRRSLVVWQEHCSECAMPGCYSSCAFYSPRWDYKCRRFTGGVDVLPATEYAGTPLHFRFGQWARLLGYGPAPLVPASAARKREQSALRNAGVLTQISPLRGLAAPLLRRQVNAQSRTSSWGECDVDRLYLVLEVHNPAPAAVSLTLNCKVLDQAGEERTRPLQAVLSLEPGYTVRAVPVSAFVAAAHVGRRFAIELAPTDADAQPELSFGFIDIAELASAPNPAVLLAGAAPAAAPVRDPGACAPRAPAAPAAAAAVTGDGPKIKCVIWDLDNTVWEGVLVEDDVGGLRLRPEAVQAIYQLDRQGILQSIASKNDEAVAMAALRHFGLADFFLAPQISWGPKSHAIPAIAKRLNIGTDTFAFVDDQQFERAEVSAQHPEVLVLDSADLGVLALHPRFDVEVTAEAAMRRRLYQEEEQRNAALEAVSTENGNYEEFLRSCDMRVRIAPLEDADIARAHELAQRTNQLNIWSSRYTVDQLRALLADGSVQRAFTVRAEDRFGSYGLVGLCVIDEPERLVRDLMFSCRIQGKLVGETFVAWLAERYESASAPLAARYKVTRKNAPARALLEATGFAPAAPLDEGERWTQTQPFRPLAELATIVTVHAPGHLSSQLA